jgi:hypothetical protein
LGKQTCSQSVLILHELVVAVDDLIATIQALCCDTPQLTRLGAKLPIDRAVVGTGALLERSRERLLDQHQSVSVEVAANVDLDPHKGVRLERPLECQSAICFGGAVGVENDLPRQQGAGQRDHSDQRGHDEIKAGEMSDVLAPRAGCCLQTAIGDGTRIVKLGVTL